MKTDIFRKWTVKNPQKGKNLSISLTSHLYFDILKDSFDSRRKRTSKSSVPAAADRDRDEATWDCSVCTFKNNAEAFKCSMCDVRKGTSTRKPRLNPDIVALQQAQALTPPPPNFPLTEQPNTSGSATSPVPSSSKSEAFEQPEPEEEVEPEPIVTPSPSPSASKVTKKEKASTSTSKKSETKRAQNK